jgi:hypothetical protein
MKMRFASMLLLGFCAPSFGDELTVGRYILEINADGSDSTHYYKATDGSASSTSVAWGSASCPNAVFVYTRDLQGQKDLLAIALSASAMGRMVKFRGTCDSDGIYFRATRIVMSQ